jgi:maltooligosyltrehalose trehalohydrolase
VHFLQNHDQVANSATGRRLHELTSEGCWRAMTALWLLSPQTPMFFQGQEFAASSPFLFFVDIGGTDGEQIAAGREQFLSQFPSIAAEGRNVLPDPRERSTFERSKLDWNERRQQARSLQLHQDLLRLRREDRLLRRQRLDLLEVASLSPDCLVVRHFDDDEERAEDRLLLVNLGRQWLYSPSPQPLLAPPARRRWKRLWSSEDVRYGGRGTPGIETNAGWNVPGQCAVLLSAEPANGPRSSAAAGGDQTGRT